MFFPKCSKFLILFLTATLFVSPLHVSKAEEFGEFTGALKIELQGERNAKLLEDFSYIGPDGKNWTAPKGVIVNGASIPSIFWLPIGSPWVGEYRQASVIHDHYCNTEERDWKETHRAFYTAALAGGTGPLKAKIMYGAIVYFGPKWRVEKGISGSTTFRWQNEYDQESFEQLEAWIKENNPTLEEIENLIQ